MRIHANLNERTASRSFAEPRLRQRPLIVVDRTLPAFGLRIGANDKRTFFVRVNRGLDAVNLTLGTPAELTAAEARAMALAEIGTANAERETGPLFRDFVARYRERRSSRWKPSLLKTFDIYMRGRLMPRFGNMRLDRIDHPRLSAWFDAASAERPGAANRAFEILRAMLRTARQWGELAPDAPDPCANIVLNPRRPVARHLDRAELERLGAVLHRHAADHSWPVAALRLLTLTGARLSEVLNLRWEAPGELTTSGAWSARTPDCRASASTTPATHTLPRAS